MRKMKGGDGMIGFDIGGTKCAVSVGEEHGGALCILDKRVIPTDHEVSPEVMIARMCAAAEEMTSDFSQIGISCGGPLDASRGVILSPPNLPGWDEVEIVRILTERYGSYVRLQNDANACALAEWRYGAGKGCRNMIFLTFGSGLGAGLILDGRLYEGTNGMAGEVGHIRLSDFGPVGYGKRGSFEGFCSGNGIASLGRMLAEEALQVGKRVSYCEGAEALSAITAKRIAECAKAGHADAARVYEICGEKLGAGLSVLIDILNPERIVIGSVYQRSAELLIPSMTRVLEREALGHALSVCRIVPAELKENIGDYAALSCAVMEKE